MRVAFHTLGCKVNHYETEAIREAFVSRGAVCVGEEDPADVYIINTCTVTNIADRKSRQYIRRMKKASPDALIVVTGCYAQVEPDEIASMPEVGLVVGNGQKSKICRLVLEQLEHYTPGAAGISVLERNELTEYEDMGIVASAEPGRARAYIKIQDGCDRFCSYCLIPYARGPVRSRRSDEILEEASMLIGSGINELVLTGINTALYGSEDGAECTLAELLDRLDELETPDGRDFRIRLSSLEPTVIDRDDALRIIDHRRLCHHLHLSVQSGSDRILTAMNRHYSRDDYLDIVRAIRGFDPLYGITTDIIVGFPGETETDFADTLDIVQAAGFGRVHVFRFSPRKGTAGARLADAVPGNIKNNRADTLSKESEAAAADFMRANTGTLHRVLIEEHTGEFATGYTGNYIRTYISDPEGRLKDGCFVDAVIDRLYLDGCIASPAN